MFSSFFFLFVIRGALDLKKFLHFSLTRIVEAVSLNWRVLFRQKYSHIISFVTSPIQYGNKYFLPTLLGRWAFEVIEMVVDLIKRECPQDCQQRSSRIDEISSLDTQGVGWRVIIARSPISETIPFIHSRAPPRDRYICGPLKRTKWKYRYKTVERICKSFLEQSINERRSNRRPFVITNANEKRREEPAIRAHALCSYYSRTFGPIMRANFE